MQLSKIINFFQPWKLPEDWPKTWDMTTQELAEEARGQRQLLRAFGYFDSAITHPQLINQQYLRACQYNGVIPIKPYVALYAIPMLMMVMFGTLFAVFNTDLQVHTAISFVIGGTIGALWGMGVGHVTMAVMQFETAYASSLSFQLNGNEPLKCLNVPVLRMSCVDNPHVTYVGSSADARFDKGALLLMVPEDVDVTQIQNSYQIHQWESLQGFQVKNESELTKRFKSLDISLNIQSVPVYRLITQGKISIQSGMLYVLSDDALINSHLIMLDEKVKGSIWSIRGLKGQELTAQVA